jgi:hypothetical protein
MDNKFPYPCIGLFRFLDFSIRKSPVYDEVLQRVKNGQKFLDMGCCFAQDIRALVITAQKLIIAQLTLSIRSRTALPPKTRTELILK